MFQYFGYAMHEGDILYTEIFDHKGPVIFIINWLAGYMNFGVISGIWLIELASIFVFFIFTYKTARIWVNPVLSFIPILITALPLAVWLTGGNLTEEYSLPFIAFSLYVFTKYLLKCEDVYKYEIILTGLSFAAVFLLRPNNAMLWVIFAGFIFFDLLFKKQFSSLLIFMGQFLLGVAIVVVPILIYLGMNQAISAAYFQTWTFNISYLGDTSFTEGDIAKQFKVLNAYYLIQLMLTYVLIFLYQWKQLTKESRTVYLLNVLFTLLTGFLIIGSGRAYNHYLIILLPCVTVVIPLILRTIFSRRTKLLFSLILVGCVLLGYHESLSTNQFNRSVLNSDGEFSRVEDELEAKYIKKYVDEKRYMTELAVFVKENTEPDERIYSHRLAGNVYLLSERLASIKYFNLPSIDLDNSKLIAEDFLDSFLASNTRLVVVKRSFIDNKKSQAEEFFYQHLLTQYQLRYDNNGHLVFIKK